MDDSANELLCFLVWPGGGQGRPVHNTSEQLVGVGFLGRKQKREVLRGTTQPRLRAFCQQVKEYDFIGVLLQKIPHNFEVACSLTHGYHIVIKWVINGVAQCYTPALRTKSKKRKPD